MFSFLNIGIAAAIMLVLTPFVALSPVVARIPGSSAACVLLGCLGTGVAYIWNQNTVRAWGPTRASTVTYITPIVGVALGIARPRRELSAGTSRSAPLVVFLGILLAQDRLRSLRRVRGARP